MAWDPATYMRFGDQRTRPAIDLLARVSATDPARVVDLGCGPGNSTALLTARWPKSVITGIDSSAEMIAEANGSGVIARFVVGDFETWAPEETPDVIFANAAFQWSRDPVALVRRLYALLPVGGVLAFQVPQNFDQPAHIAVRDIAGKPAWAGTLADARWYDPAGFARGEHYARALAPLDAQLDVWTTDYLHQLTGPDPVFRWMEGTGLRPFLSRLEGEARAAFAAEVKAALSAAYPPEPDGTTLFPFRRLFVVAANTRRDDRPVPRG